MKAFFVPILKSESDTGNFDVEFTSCQVESFEEETLAEMETKDKFKDFSYGNEE